MADRYRVAREFTRTAGHPDGPETFEVGDEVEPTEAELRLAPDRFEETPATGPYEDENQMEAAGPNAENEEPAEPGEAGGPGDAETGPDAGPQPDDDDEGGNGNGNGGANDAASDGGEDELTQLDGVGASTADRLRDAGYESADDIGSADPDALADEVDGISTAKAHDLVNQTSED